jgi:cathepsin B
MSAVALICALIAAPPNLVYDYVADVRHGGLMPRQPSHVVVSYSKPVFAISIPPPMGSRSNHTEVQFKCNDGVNQMDIDRFFDEHVCYNLSLQERVAINTQAECMAYELASFMPLTGTLKAACADQPWCTHDPSTGGPSLTKLYAQATNQGKATFEGKQLDKYVGGTATFLVDPTSRLLYAIYGGGLNISFHGLVSPAPPSETTPTFAGACVNMSAESPFADHVRLNAWLAVDAAASEIRRAPPPEWSRPADDARLVEAINAEEGLGWVAQRYGWSGTAAQLASARLGLKPSLTPNLPPSPHAEDLAAAGPDPPPAAFDARDAWPDCASIGEIRNQGTCGSCWAFSAATVLTDRICVASKAKDTPRLAPESLVDCDDTDDGCDGGWLDNVWEYMEATGVREEACMPYQHCPNETAKDCGKKEDGTNDGSLTASLGGATACPAKCSDGSVPTAWKAKSAYVVGSPGDVGAMQRELMAHGPLQVEFFVFQDFMSYGGGVYKRSSAAAEFHPVGRHAVRLVGWGEDEEAGPFWLVANSWSAEWGERGFFRIRRGANECGIESTPAAGLAA